MSDTAELRRRGVPTVTLCWDDFEPVARLHARVLHIEDAPICVYPRRLPGEGEDDDVQHVPTVIACLLHELGPHFGERSG